MFCLSFIHIYICAIDVRFDDVDWQQASGASAKLCVWVDRVLWTRWAHTVTRRLTSHEHSSFDYFYSSSNTWAHRPSRNRLVRVWLNRAIIFLLVVSREKNDSWVFGACARGRVHRINWIATERVYESLDWTVILINLISESAQTARNARWSWPHKRTYGPPISEHIIISFLYVGLTRRLSSPVSASFAFLSYPFLLYVSSYFFSSLSFSFVGFSWSRTVSIEIFKPWIWI